MIFAFSAHSSRSRISKLGNTACIQLGTSRNKCSETEIELCVCECNCRSSLINTKRTRLTPPAMSVTLRIVVCKSFQRLGGAGEGGLFSYLFFSIWSIWRRMLRRFMHDEFEIILKEAVVV
jgi:hypothetical protein